MKLQAGNYSAEGLDYDYTVNFRLINVISASSSVHNLAPSSGCSTTDVATSGSRPGASSLSTDNVSRNWFDAWRF